MKKMLFLISATLLCLASAFSAMAAATATGTRVVIYDNVATEVAPPPATLAAVSDDLWVTLADLTRATKFALKPQGVCRDQLCFPIPKARKPAFLSTQGKITWFNLSEFARLVHQPAAHEAENSTWYIGPRSEEHNSFVSSLVAPNFTLPDAGGKQHSLSEFRGKKVLLLTWASW
jgi:hypothetical protein